MKSKILIFVLVLIPIGCWLWNLKHNMNYKWNYQSRVQAEIDLHVKPLTERVKQLEVEIKMLKENK
jgi:hypothetical protein